MNIPQALLKLDAANDEHWTADGLPQVKAVTALLGAEVTRKDITNAAPDFNRQKLQEEVDRLEKKRQDEPEPEPSEPVPEDVIATTINKLIGIEDDVVGLDPREVFSDLNLCDRALAEFERQGEVVTKIRDAAIAKLQHLGQLSARVNKARAPLAKANPEPNGIQAYLERNKQNRMERARRVRAFTESGIERTEVLADLAGAPVDQAMARRKGRGRPQYPVQGQG